MKFPTHIILDSLNSNPSNTQQYWVLRYLININNKPFSLDSFKLPSTTQIKVKGGKRLSKNLFKFTVIVNKKRVSTLHNSIKILLSKKEIKSTLWDENKINSTYKILRKLNPNITPNKKNLFLHKNSKGFEFTSNKLWSIFNIYFLKKEKIYTKLKYSRVPQYDIVSGGLSVIFCGFLGFLVCEKYGFELIDSGEFYMLLMYVVFLVFFLKLLLKIFEQNGRISSIFSPKYIIKFYTQIIILTIKPIKNLAGYFMKNYK